MYFSSTNVKNFVKLTLVGIFSVTDTQLSVLTTDVYKLQQVGILPLGSNPSANFNLTNPVSTFNLVLWNATDYTDPSDDPNAEIVTVNSINNNTLTVTRGQENTTPTSSIGNKTYKLILTVTKALLDFYTSQVFPIPVATDTILGGVKIGSGINVDVNGVISTINNGTVTNVSALTIGTSGTDITSTVVNGGTTPVITLNIPTASASNRGALSSTDWSTFNAKQSALSGSGFIKISGTTISYDPSIYITSVTSGMVTSALGYTPQPTLVSGTNIKTVNGNSLLGSGDVTISSIIAWGSVTGTLSSQTDLQNALNAKQATVTAGTGLSFTGATLNNTAPDQTVSITGSGITVTGTYPNFTLTNPNPTPYTLPISSASTLGGIKVGSGLSIDGSGILSATGGSGMVYPGAGIPVSTGSAWGTSISGTSSQFVKANGSLDSSTYLTSSSLSGYVPFTGAGTDLDLNAKSFKNFFISKTADTTSKMAFDVSNLSTATTRTLTVPNRSLTLDNITTSTTSNGTGFVKSNGTSITFDNSTYLTGITASQINTALGLTASQIVATDGSGNLQSLAVATYPSLTELSYVKGVTSAIQTQLNSKGTFTLPALTSGSVLFSNGTTIAQDNSNFFWDATNHRLGIGTATPLGAIDIRGLNFGTTAGPQFVGSSSNPNLNHDYAAFAMTNTDQTNGNYASFQWFDVANQNGAALYAGIFGYYIQHSTSAPKMDIVFATNNGAAANNIREVVRVTNDGYLQLSKTSSGLKFLGATSGSTIIQAASVAGTNTFTLPTSTVTNGVWLDNGSGVLTNTNTPTLTGTNFSGIPNTALSSALQSIAGLTYASTSFVKMTSAGTFALDTNTYLTANQSITLSGAVTGSGTTAITTTLATNIVGASNMKGASSTQLANGSSGNLLKSLGDGTFAWDTNTYLTSSSISGMTTGQLAIAGSTTTITSSIGYSTTPTASTIAEWDANKNLSAVNHIEGYTSTATAAGTTTMTITSTYQQYWTGSTTQTVKLPTTSVVAGGQYSITNNSTGSVTVQSSGANTILILGAGQSAVFTAIVATPTTAANWNYSLTDCFGINNAITASGNAATVNLAYKTNTITNNSAATLTVTIPTAGAVDGMMRVLRIFPSSAVAQTLTLVNTENSTVTPPANTGASTTIPIQIGVIFNGATTKWTVIASA